MKTADFRQLESPVNSYRMIAESMRSLNIRTMLRQPQQACEHLQS